MEHTDPSMFIGEGEREGIAIVHAGMCNGREEREIICCEFDLKDVVN